MSLSENFLREGRQLNMASYRANLNLDLVLDLDSFFDRASLDS